METGYDILFFWVARMIMMGLEFTGQVPFHTVYLHGLVRDEHSRKMSKTYGNVIDPLVVMDEFGTDALRFTLLVGSTPGNDTNVGLKKVESNRNFANKLWNAGRFVTHALSALEPAEPGGFTLADSWIWARLQSLVREVERLFQTFQYGEAGRQIYEFIWSDFADWYVEIAKHELAEGGLRAARAADTLARVFDLSLRLLHPFTPFVTEEIWGHLRRAVQDSPLASLAADWPEALIVAEWPEPRQPEDWEESKVGDFAVVQEVVRAIRNLRSEKNIPASKKLPALLAGGNRAELLRDQAVVIASLAGLDPTLLSVFDVLDEKPENTVSLVVGAVEIFLPLADALDMEADRRRLEKELSEAQAQIERLEKLLSSDFASKAPPQVVARERDRLAGFRETADKIRAQLL
jgi:valyl-tRNA synthetase